MGIFKKTFSNPKDLSKGGNSCGIASTPTGKDVAERECQKQQRLLDDNNTGQSSSIDTFSYGFVNWIGRKSEHCEITRVLNVVFYILCIAAFGGSVLLNYRQNLLEERIRHMHFWNERLEDFESRLNTILAKDQTDPHRGQLFRDTNGGISRLGPQEATPIQSRATNEHPTEVGMDFESIKRIVHRLNLKVDGIQRQRRDVSRLRVNRQQRQTAIEQSPDICSCPPGNLCAINHGFVFFKFDINA